MARTVCNMEMISVCFVILMRGLWEDHMIASLFVMILGILLMELWSVMLVMSAAVTAETTQE